MKTYAAYCNETVRSKSSSGGIFSTIAKEFDVVYGVSMTSDCYDAMFVRVENDIDALRGSKYFQAKLGDTYKLVKQDLLNGKLVLFTGTGCQINGLFLFLQKEYPNLFMLDVICHGTPSQKLWERYIEFQEKKYGKINKVDFRSKDYGWKGYGLKLNDVFCSHQNDTFMRIFLRNYCLRPSCYKCVVKRNPKADITLGDFWGIETVAPEIDDDNGVSVIFCRTNKGVNLFNHIKNKLVWKEVSYEEGVYKNTSEYESVAKPRGREHFYEDLNRLEFSEIEKKYASDIKISWIRLFVRRVRRFLHKIFMSKYML